MFPHNLFVLSATGEDTDRTGYTYETLLNHDRPASHSKTSWRKPITKPASTMAAMSRSQVLAPAIDTAFSAPSSRLQHPANDTTATTQHNLAPSSTDTPQYLNACSTLFLRAFSPLWI